MDYKKIIRSRRLRIGILNILSFLPDQTMLKIQYYIKMGRRLNLDNPQRYTEKIQWYKLNYKNPIMKKCVNKFEVREYVADMGFSENLIPCVGVYDRWEDIAFEALPDKFVMKDTLGGGGNNVIICKDKRQFNKKKTKEIVDMWWKENKKKNPGREWFYEGGKHQIYIEHYLESESKDGGLIDYKFFCFNGVCEYLYVITDRKVGDKAQFGIYDKNYKRLPYIRLDEKAPKRVVEKPAGFKDMIRMAERLSEPFPHVRVDLYCVGDKIWFGELTFCDGSGYMKFEPDSFDFILGKKFELPHISDK